MYIKKNNGFNISRNKRKKLSLEKKKKKHNNKNIRNTKCLPPERWKDLIMPCD